MINKSKLLEALIKRTLQEAEDDDIPYAEEIPDDSSTGNYDSLDSVLNQVKEDYSKAKKYLDAEAVKLMSGTALIDLVKNSELARSKERELEKANDFYDKKSNYYEDRIDDFYEKEGYDNSTIKEISKYNEGLRRLSSDMYDAAQIWYKLNGIVEELVESYNEEKSMKSFINLKTVEL